MAILKALVIDYEPRGIRQLREPLHDAGFDVHVVQDGLTGRRVFDHLAPDIVIVEAMLPKKNGFELCGELKDTAAGAGTPVVVVSSVYRGRKYRSQAIHHYGADEFLEKPVSPEALVETALRLIERYRAERADRTGPPATAGDAEGEISDRVDDLFGPSVTVAPDPDGDVVAFEIDADADLSPTPQTPVVGRRPTTSPGVLATHRVAGTPGAAAAPAIDPAQAPRRRNARPTTIRRRRRRPEPPKRGTTWVTWVIAVLLLILAFGLLLRVVEV